MKTKMKKIQLGFSRLVAAAIALFAFGAVALSASARTMTMTVNRTDGDVSSFDFTFDNTGAGTTNSLWMACGNGDSGASFSGWTSIRHVADIPGDTTSLAGVLPPSDWGADVVCLRFLLSDAETVPGADRLDYIKSSGSQYIMTSFVPKGASAVETKFSFTRTDHAPFVFCARSNFNDHLFGLYWSGSSWRFDFNTAKKYVSASPGTAVHTLRADSTGLKVDGAPLADSAPAASSDFTAGSTMSVFAAHVARSSISAYADMSLYSFKAWLDGSDPTTLALDLVPCKKGGVACVFDKVGGTFLENLGSGSFTAGTVVSAAATLEVASDPVFSATLKWAVPCSEPVWWLESVDNWSPARFPGASSTVVLGTASVSPVDVYLASGDTIAVTNLSVANAANAVARIEVRSGASLTLGDPVSTNWFADATSAFSKLDVSGGALAVNGPAWFSDAGTGNVIRVTDGGTIDFNNTVVFGKSGSGYTGPTKMYIGPGSIVRQNASYDFILGDGKTSGVGGGHGGEIEIDGGTFVAGKDFFIHCAPYGTWQGRGVIRLKGGDFSFAGTGQNIHFFGGGNMPNAFIQSGGQFTGCLSFQAGTGSDNLVEISGGTNTCDRWRFGTWSGNTTGRMHMRIVGRNGVVKVGGGSFHTPYNKEDFTEPPILMEFVVDPSTRRDSTYPVTPVYVTKWGGGNGGYVLVRGVHHIRPAGGAQLVHQDYFPMYVKGHDGWISGHSGENMEAPDAERGIGRYRAGTDDQYQTVGEEMWTNQFVTVYNNSEFFDTPSNAWQFRQKLKAEAEIASGAAALETPVVRGWMALPSLTARNLERMETARVRLAVTPGAGETLQSIVDGFKANGYPDSAVESDGIYNVSLVIPTERLAAGVSTDKILFDFAVYPNYAAAKNKTPTVRATLSAAKWDPEIKQSGLIMFVR